MRLGRRVGRGIRIRRDDYDPVEPAHRLLKLLIGLLAEHHEGRMRIGHVISDRTLQPRRPVRRPVDCVVDEEIIHPELSFQNLGRVARCGIVRGGQRPERRCGDQSEGTDYADPWQTRKRMDQCFAATRINR